MFSRSVARSAIRYASKPILSASRFTILRALPKTPVVSISTRYFSNSSSCLEANNKSLVSIINSEIELEESDPESSNPLIKDFLAKSDFKLTSKEGTDRATLTKETDSEIIEISFSVREVAELGLNPEFGDEDGLVDENNENENDAEENDDYMDDPYDESFAELEIIISKKSDKTAIAYDVQFRLGETDFMINSLTPYKTAAEAISPLTNRNETPYLGPAFSNLDNDLQISIESYLRSRGLDGELSEFLITFSEEKENSEYINWLKKLKAFYQ